MPQFKVAKTDDIIKIQNDLSTDNKLIEDKLYIYKESNKYGRLFFIFDDNTKIEIGSLENIFTTTLQLTQELEEVSVNDIRKYNSDETQTQVNIDDIQINAFVTNNKALYNVRYIDTENNSLILRRVYAQQDLKWNDHYGVDYTHYDLSNGNSIAARIVANGGNVQTDFVDNGYMYDGINVDENGNGVYYSPKAWLGENLDLDEKAFFAYVGETITLPEVIAYGPDGTTQVSVTTELVTENGDVTLLSSDTLTLDEQTHPLGVYTLRYSIYDSDIIATRNLVVLLRLGDANKDTWVNAIDGNFIRADYSTMPEDTAVEKLYKYRVCDVNKDDVVDSTDADAVYQRYGTPIIDYYR